ncbi:MAG: hypothetical protein JXA41_02390 [Deltaproteobacteria bacterium]|nr:hypothetical protein [Deltaproteobacteria bacterium]
MQSGQKRSIGFIISLFVGFLLQGAVLATEVYLQNGKGKPGQIVVCPVVIDDVKNLAGIKLVLKYDPELLTFKEGANTKHSRSLMHVINDKTPGKLILVMAGAKGIGGKDLNIMVLKFMIKKNKTDNPSNDGKQNARLDITEIQLMDDQLKEVKAKTKSGVISILP